MSEAVSASAGAAAASAGGETTKGSGPTEEKKKSGPGHHVPRSAGVGGAVVAVPAEKKKKQERVVKNKQLSIPQQISLTKPLDYKGAFDFYRSIGSPKYVCAPMVRALVLQASRDARSHMLAAC